MKEENAAQTLIGKNVIRVIGIVIRIQEFTLDELSKIRETDGSDAQIVDYNNKVWTLVSQLRKRIPPHDVHSSDVRGNEPTLSANVFLPLHSCVTSLPRFRRKLLPSAKAAR